MYHAVSMYTWHDLATDPGPSCPTAPNAEGDCAEGRCQRLGRDRGHLGPPVPPIHDWLVVWNIFFLPYIGNNHPH